MYIDEERLQGSAVLVGVVNQGSSNPQRGLLGHEQALKKTREPTMAQTQALLGLGPELPPSVFFRAWAWELKGFPEPKGFRTLMGGPGDHGSPGPLRAFSDLRCPFSCVKKPS